MPGQLSRLFSTISRFFAPPVRALSTRLATLSPGDKLIASVLGLFVLISGFVGLYALERAFLVKVPAHGGSLTEGLIGTPRFINPLLALSDADRDLTRLTYAGLMGIGEDGNLTPVLAESYSVSEDGKTYTFVLRENAEFSDGRPVTAEDIVFTVGKAQDPGLKSPELSNWANIRAEVVDARTVSFTLPKAYAPFLEDTTLGILPAHLWRNVSNAEFPFSPRMEKPIGAGPFKVRSVVRGGDGTIEKYVLEANSRYVLGRPYLDEITFVFFDQEENLENALKAGHIESAYGIATKNALSAPYSRVFGVFFNGNENPLFARPEVREALSIAIDREGIIRDALGGYATVAQGPVPPGSLPVSEETILSEEERRAAAAEVLEAKDWEYDEETRAWTNDGLVLEVTIKTSNVPELKAVASAIQDQWGRFGIPTSVELYEPGDLTQTVIRPRAFDALLFGMVVGRDQDLFAFWNSSERNDPGLNISMYTNPSVDQLLAQIREETDPEERQEALERVNALVASDYPAAFTHAPDFLYAIPTDLKGVTLTRIASPSDRLATVAHWYRRTEMVWPAFARE
ncbi:MAG: peptide ABC transporter substrate-binding protein [Patescibacteria group bacterium]